MSTRERKRCGVCKLALSKLQVVGHMVVPHGERRDELEKLLDHFKYYRTSSHVFVNVTAAGATLGEPHADEIVAHLSPEGNAIFACLATACS